MSYSIKDTTITMTRGDTLRAQLHITDSDGNPYIPSAGDKIRFAAKSKYTDMKTLIFKEIPINIMILQLDPEDTKSLNFGKYVYDIQITKENGDVDTFITKAELRITEEVD